MNGLRYQKQERGFLKKVILTYVLIGVALLFIGCNRNQSPEKIFAEELTDAASYKVEGVMESFYETGRKQNDFTVFYKSPDLIKVIIKSEDSNDKQIILKNKEGVYILIPSVNKNFKIQSDWPENASYPYLLQSLVKDIVNDEELLTTDGEDTFTIETETKMHTDATPVRQKIIFDKATNLPTEVLVYDENDNLYIRTVFTNIDLKFNVSDDEFDLANSMAAVRLEYEEEQIVYQREIGYPRYVPTGITLVSENTIRNVGGTEVLSVMKYGSQFGFTIVQEYINDREVSQYQEENGYVIMVLGNVGILKANSVQVVYNGVEITLASKDLTIEEMVKIVQSYMTDDENK